MRNHRAVASITACASGALLVAVGLTGCAGLGGAPSTAGASGPESPLEKYWSLLYAGEDQSDLDRANAQMQEVIAECMTEQGFEYLPSEANGGMMIADDSGLDWQSEEFAKAYGYGITTDPLGMDSEAGAGPVDPNADYIASLSESEQAAYNTALWGAPPPETSGDAEMVEFDWTTAGCNGKAQHEVMGESGLGSDPEFDALTEGMSSLYTEVRESPAVLEKERIWSDCLADAGFGDFEHKDDASATISEEYSGLFGAPDEGTSSSATPPEPDPAALKALREREIAQAVADFECARDSEYAATLTSEQFRLEQAFVDEHKAELDALVARHGSSDHSDE